MNSIAVYILSPQAIEPAKRLRVLPGVELYAPATICAAHPDCMAQEFTSLPRLVGEIFQQRAAHIFLGATGIAVRCIAPHLAGKDRDPAVLVVDPAGTFVISLLSGHLGGANALTLRVAELLGAQPVITTASDTFGLPALDLLAQEKGLRIANLPAATAVAAALVAGRPVFLDDPDDLLGLQTGPHAHLFCPAPPESPAGNALTVCAAGHPTVRPTVRVTLRPTPAQPESLVLHPPVFAGIGCRRGSSAEDILGVLQAALERADVAAKAVVGLASVSLKADEPGLLQAAEMLELPIRFFEPEALAAFPTETVSPKALEVLGIPGVCESAALALAGPGGRLLAGKMAERGVTVALATR